MYQSEKDFTAGTLPITYGSDADKPVASPKRIDELNSTYTPEFSGNWVYLPDQGGMYSSVSSFPAATALNRLQTDSATSPTWDSYMADKGDPFALEANVTKKDGGLRWSFAIGDRESKQTLNTTASEGGACSAYVFDGNENPKYKTTDFEPLLSLSGAQSAISNLTKNLTTDDLIKNARADMFGSSGDLDLNDYQFGVRTAIATPSLDMTSATYFLYLKYGYVIEKKDASDSYSLALDAETGQLAYVWYHKETQTGFQNPFGGLFR